MFKRENRDWTDYRSLPSNWEVEDYHPNDSSRSFMDYYQRMDAVYEDAIAYLRKAQENGIMHVIFRHGLSTSRVGKTTSRSQIRKAMRSKEATPYIIRNKSIQHPSVFVAFIRPKADCAPRAAS
jgi:hypothetical protein